jgi:hypothetical protein
VGRGRCGADFGGIARDLDWALTVVLLIEAAVATGAEELAGRAVLLLEPYAGRAVVNGGGVAFAGVVDDYLARACELLGREEEARRWAARAAAAYERIGATWWSRRLAPLGRPTGRPTGQPGVVHLRPGADGIWWVAPDGAVTTLRDMRGLHSSGPASTSRPLTCPTRSPGTPEPGWSRGARVRCSTGRQWSPTGVGSPRSTRTSTRRGPGPTRGASRGWRRSGTPCWTSYARPPVWPAGTGRGLDERAGTRRRPQGHRHRDRPDRRRRPALGTAAA